MSKLLTTKEAAAFLTLSPITLEGYRCRHAGPPFIQVGGAIRYSQDALEEWLRSRTVTPEDRDSPTWLERFPK